MPAEPEQTANQQRPLLVALTGGIASGKTAVSDRLSERGAVVIDTDLIAREVVEPGQPGRSAIVEAFGPEMLDSDGRLDRAAMRQRVFSEPDSRKRLESILHPLIAERVKQRIAAEQDADYLVLVVPLLVESGLFLDADRIVVVDVPQSVQLERLAQRDGTIEEQARAILASQASREQRLKVATDVVDNSGSLAELERAADQLHNELLTKARRLQRSKTTAEHYP